MATPNFAQAHKSLISVNGALFNALTITYDERAPLEDITYTKTGGASFADKIPGYASGSGSTEFIYDAANQPVLSPFIMYVGALMTIIMQPEGTKPYSFSAYSTHFTWRGGPQAIAGGTSVHCTVDWESTGTITRPTS